MCTYNGAKYLREQLESIIHQTYPVYELIIQDDCSTDNTFKILKEYSEKYPYICIYCNPKTIGVNKNFFLAMDRATGDYIAISDQDDIWELNKIEKQMETINDNWLSGHFTKPFTDENIPLHFDGRKPNYTIERLIYATPLPGHTLLIKKDMLGLVSEEMKNSHAYDPLLNRIAGIYNKIAFCEQILTHHRRHLSAVSYTIPVSYKRNFANYFRTIRRTFANYWALRDQMQAHYARMYEFMKSFPEKNQGKTNAERLARYQSQRGLWSYLKLTFLCIKLGDKLFYTKEKSSIFAFLRSVYFPLSSSDCFMYMLPETKKNESRNHQ
jgi:glycosyltransferase involved in cell wall biosynthesis